MAMINDLLILEGNTNVNLYQMNKQRSKVQMKAWATLEGGNLYYIGCKVAWGILSNVIKMVRNSNKNKRHEFSKDMHDN